MQQYARAGRLIEHHRSYKTSGEPLCVDFCNQYAQARPRAYNPLLNRLQVEVFSPGWRW